ncbi:hypothetical protein ACQ4PT_029538 [Festuca glaucescens]
MDFAVNTALWVVGKALAPVTDGLLESWAASAGLGPNVDALKMQLLCAQGMLDSAQGKDIHSDALKEHLNKLCELAYGTDDVLDELDYFRIQDALDGTYHAANMDGQGYIGGLVLNARHTGRTAANKLKPSRLSDASHGDPNGQEDGGKQGCLSVVRSCGGRVFRMEVDGGCTPKVVSCARNTAHTIGKHFPSYSFPSVQEDDAESDMLETSNMAGSGRRFLCGTWPSKAPLRNLAVQTQTMKFYQVEISTRMVEIVEQLKPLCAMVSTILSLQLLGSSHIPTQDIAMDRPKTTPNIIEPELYGRNDLKKNIVDDITHDRLVQEIVKKIAKVEGEKDNASNEEPIEQRLKSKRLLLVLDDVWKYHEDEWKKLLSPLRYNRGEKGHVVIVTTRIPKVSLFN